MSKTVGEVAIDVTADIGPLVRETNRAKSQLSGLQRATARMGTGLQSAGRSVTSFGAKMSVVSAGIAAAAGSAFLLTQNVAAIGDEAAKTARQVGVSAEYFQELEFAMGQVTNLTKSELTNAMQRLNRTLGEASDGSQMAIDAFAKIGISQADIASGAVTTEQAMDRLIQTLSDTTDPAIAAAIANDLMGRTGAKLGGQLSGASGAIAELRDRAHELGIVMSDEALDASEKFNDGMDELRRGFDGLKIKLGNELLPVFVNRFIPAMVDKVIPALGSVVEKVANLINWFGDLPAPVQEAAAMIGLALGVGGPILVGVGLVMTAIGGLIAATGPIGLLIAAASLLIAAWTIWGDDIKKIVGDAVDFISAKFTAFMDFITGIPEKMKEIGQNIIQGLLDGINERWEALKERIYALAEMLPQWMRDLLEIKSPSQVFAEIGEQIGAGLAEGIAASTDMVRASIADIAGQAVGEADNMVSGVLGAAASLFSGSKKIALAQAAVNVAQGITEALKLPFPANLAAAAKVAAAGAAQIGQIRSANVGSGSVAAPASGAANIPVNSSPAVALQLIGSDNSTFSGGQIRQLITAINEATEGGSIVRLV